MKIFYDDGEKIESCVSIRDRSRDEIFYVINGNLSTSARDGFNAGKVEKLSKTNCDYDGDPSRIFVWEFKRIDFRYTYGGTFSFTALAYVRSDEFGDKSPLHYFTDPLPVDDPEWYYPPEQPQKYPVMELEIEVYFPTDNARFEKWLFENKESWM